jgi:hypothetical protein
LIRDVLIPLEDDVAVEDEGNEVENEAEDVDMSEEEDLYE